MAGRTWEELNAEAQNSVATKSSTAAGLDDDALSSTAQSSATDGIEWLALWGVERSSLPEWLVSFQVKDNAIRNKMRGVVKQEWVYMGDREFAVAVGGKGEDEMFPEKSQLPPPGPPLLDKSGRFFDLGSYMGESTAFPFVLIESFLKYSDPKLVREELGGRGDGSNVEGGDEEGVEEGRQSIGR